MPVQINPTRVYQAPITAYATQPSVTINETPVISRAKKQSVQELVAELADSQKTPLGKELQSHVENKLLTFVGPNVYLTPQILLEFHKHISEIPNKSSFTQAVKRKLSLDRRSQLLDALSKLNQTCLNQRLNHELEIEGDPNRVIGLLRLGADPNWIGRHQTTIPSWARGNTDLLEAWINCPGANVNIQGPLGRTPLTIVAAFCHSPQLIRQLIAQGADINAVDKEGITPLMACAIKRQHENMKMLLRTTGVNLLTIEKSGRNAWDLADNVGKMIIRQAIEAAMSSDKEQLNLHTKPNPSHMALQQELSLTPIGLSAKEITQSILSQFDAFGLIEHQAGLIHLLRCVETRTPKLTALPRGAEAKKAFYDTMHTRLEHIVLKLNDQTVPIASKRSALSLMAEAGTWCASTQFQYTASAYRILHEDSEDLLDEDRLVHDTLYRLRNQIFHRHLSILLSKLDPFYHEHSSNVYNAVMSSVGTTLGLASPETSYPNDPHAPAFNKQAFIDAFYTDYSASIMTESLKKIPLNTILSLLNRFAPSFEKQSRIFELESKARQKPLSYQEQKELTQLQIEKQMHRDVYISSVLTDEGLLSDQAIPYLLLAMGILIPKDPQSDPLVKKYQLRVGQRPQLLTQLASHNRILLIKKQADLSRQMQIANQKPSSVQRESIEALQQEISELAKWLMPTEDILDMPIYHAAAIALSIETKKDRESSIASLMSMGFSCTIGRQLSRTQAERVYQAIIDCVDDEDILLAMNPADDLL